MNNKSILIAVICGLLTAVMLFAPLRLGAAGAFILFLSVLPLHVSTLGFGSLAGLVSAAVAAIVFAIGFGPLPALASFALTLLPAVWLGHMAGLMREEDGQDEWFPLSTLLFRLILLCAALVIATGIISGYDAQTLATTIDELYANMFKAMKDAPSGVNVPDEATMQNLAKQGTLILPVIMPISLILMHVINIHLGARFARSRDWMLRPKDDIPANVGLPMIAVGLLAVALVGTFFGGNIALVAKVFVGALTAGFAMVGLAVIHFMLRGSPFKNMILTVCYAVTLFTFFPAFIFAAIGMAETLIGIRYRRNANTQND